MSDLIDSRTLHLLVARPTPPPSPPAPTLYLLTVPQDALLGADAAVGARGVRLPLAALHVDVHVEFAAKHGYLGLRQQTHGNICRHLGDGGESKGGV